MAERSHLSIGEVLTLLREEFPDVTISKIRFLESQGLVDPERTPSGYRKFYEHDVERLRWILRQQRENFLPLKIIRGRLTEHGEEVEENGVAAGQEETPTSVKPDSPAVQSSSRGRQGTIETASSAHPAATTRYREVTAPPAPPEAAARAPATQAPARRAGGAGPVPAPSAGAAEAQSGRAGRASSTSGAGEVDRTRAGGSTQPALGEELETFSAEELAEACGGTPAMVKELQQYGLITARAVVGGTPYYDAAALHVARAAAGFSRHGVEARHLRAWRNAADREAGIFEQVIMPLLRQRNPEARRQAADTLAELAALGGDLRSALLDQALHQNR